MTKDDVIGWRGRSPHGERGLKFNPRLFQYATMLVALLTESVD